MAYDPRDKVVFITGASSGIGCACAEAFHAAGARVVAAARSVDRLKELERKHGAERMHALSLDVTDAKQRRAALTAARSRFGPIDVLVNNAGWACFAAAADLPDEHLDRMVRLNFLAPLALTQLVLPDMVRRGSGQIIMISSVVGAQPIPRMSVYSATKSALTALSVGLRMELRGTGVDVILVAPGSTGTAFFDSAASIGVRAVRLGQALYSPQRVARAVLRSSRRRRREVTLTPAGRFICGVRRVSHRLADFLIAQTARRAMPPA